MNIGASCDDTLELAAILIDLYLNILLWSVRMVVIPL